MTGTTYSETAVQAQRLRSRAKALMFWAIALLTMAVALLLIGSTNSTGMTAGGAAYITGYILGRLTFVGIPALVALVLLLRRRRLLAQARALDEQ